MKTVKAYTDKHNTATYYIDVFGDIFETLEDAELLGIDGVVVVDGFTVGSLDDMKKSALEKYHATN